MLEHGGGIRGAAARFGIPLSSWLDLSTGINPNGYPVGNIPMPMWNRLPEEGDGLEVAAREYYGCDHLLPAAGTQAIIQTLPRLLPPGPVGIVSPTYGEHAHAWLKAGFEVVEIEQVSEHLLDRLAVLVVVNPNNPTARLVAKTTLRSWWHRLWNHGGWLIVDEAFMDANGDESLSADTGAGGLLVLRSVGKFFGLAGARVGFLLGPEPLLHQTREHLGPWNVAGPSRWVTTAALADRPWQQQTRRALARDAERLTLLLETHGLKVAAKTALFQWVPTNNPMALWGYLAQSGILVRRFDSPGGLRFGLPGTQADWLRLTQVLTGVV
ncbi:MAG: threonine-phosphate decarboxylase [Magnetococcales bacterium]|nr:threonine-phosphate decarboxylase [Magnetococcales bacterium]